MKKELTISGRVEISRNEITQAIKDWLAKNYNLQVTKSTYVVHDKVMDMAVVEVRQAEGSIPSLTIPVSENTNLVRKNIGIFSFMREYFNDERKKKVKFVNLSDFYKVIHDIFPSMNEKKLAVYLHDKRQLPDIKFKQGIITVA